MSFSDTQIQALASKLSAKHVRTRQSGGRTLSYIEGWHAISEANRIFGFDAWDRQTMAIRCVWEGTWQGRYACAYIARVRVKVRAGPLEICREGCGSGHGRGMNPGEAHESALKEAETDAMKRALSTFGNPFGLALYDKEQRQVRGKPRAPRASHGPLVSWVALTSEGEIHSVHGDPVDYCKALRQALQASSSPERIRALWARNLVSIEMLRANLPDLKSEAGEHYADVLFRLYKTQLQELVREEKADREAADQQRGPRDTSHAVTAGNGPAREAGAQGASPGASGGNGGANRSEPEDSAANGQEGRQGETDTKVERSNTTRLSGSGAREQPEAGGPKGHGSVPTTESGNGLDNPRSGEQDPRRVDKSALTIGAERRIRDKEHLRYVAAQPCLVCGRSPSHAHHLRFAQRRAVGRKVSDEWTVPLCATHHRGLHATGDEQKWWQSKGIDPVTHAERLWRFGRGDGDHLVNRAREVIWPTPG